MPNLAETIGGRIRQLRGDLSQVEFAAKLGVHKDLIGKYERGLSIPGGEILAKMRDVLGVSIDWLVTGWEPPPHWEADDETYLAKMKIDEELNARVVDGIARLYKELNIGLAPMDLGRLAARMYADVVNTFDDPDERRVGLKAFLAQLRKQLMEPANATDPNETKRLA